MNQFFYTRKVGDSSFKDSFNINMVIRSYEYEKDKLFVLLSDGHEESREVPDMSNTGKQKGTKRERQWIASEIYLEGEDVVRFRRVLTNPIDSAYEAMDKMPRETNPVQMEIPFEDAQ